MRSLRTGAILALFLVCTTLGRLIAQSPAPAHHPEQTVEDLGDQSYPVRAAAEQRLRRLGRAAVPALERGLKHSDPEVRQRCTALLPLVRRSDLDIELDAFLHNQRDAKLPPLPGWARFQTMVGTDLSARSLYLQLYRREKAVLEMLEKEPDKVAKQFRPRLTQFLRIARLALEEKELESGISHFQVLMLAVLCERGEETLVDRVVRCIFHYPLARAAIGVDPALRRLVARVFAKQITSFDKVLEYAPEAKALQLTELLESHVKSLVEKQIDEAVKSKQIDQILSAVTTAKDYHCLEILEVKLKTAVLNMVEHVQASDDFSKLSDAISICQMLEMPKTLEERLKPAVMRFLINSADKIKSTQRLREASYLAEIVKLNQMLHTMLRPALIKLVAEAADNLKDRDLVQSAKDAAALLDMSEVQDSLLLPAVRRWILALLEQSNDWDCLSQAVALSKDFNLKEMLDECVKPVVAKFFRKTAFDQRNADKASQMLALAKELQIK